MKLLFVHDHIFFKDTNGDYFSAGGFPWYQWEKYQNHFENITVIGRYGGMVTNDKLVKSSANNVSYIFVDSISSLKNIRNIPKVKRIIKKEILASDAIVVRLPSENGLIAINIASENNIPFTIEVVGCAWDALWNYGGLFSKIYAPILFYRMRNAIKKGNQILYVTSEFLQKRYPADSRAITTSISNVDIPLFDESVLKQRLAKIQSQNLRSSKIVFGIIGNFKTKYKGIHTAIEALGILKEQKVIIDFELRVLGKGDSAYYLELAKKFSIEENLIFSGTLPNGSPVLEWLDKIDIYLQPSFQEGMPRSLIEAMSRACLCIGSNAGGIPELLGKDFTHNAGNAKKLAFKIKQLLAKDYMDFEIIAKNNLDKSRFFTSDILKQKRYDFYKLLKDEAIKNESN